MQGFNDNPATTLTREWLETNGLGGFASATISGLNTRRYHSLLVAATRPPVGRYVLLSKLEETLIINGRRYELSANQYPGVIHPQGQQYLQDFRRTPFPTFVYAVEDIEIEKSVFMVHGENTTVVQYKRRGAAQDCRLEIRPLIAFRDYHGTTHENNALNPQVDAQPGLASVTPYAGLPTLYFAHDGEQLELSGCWYRNFEYQLERERGLEFREDLFNPFVLTFDLSKRTTATINASSEPRKESVNTGKDVDKLRRAEIARRKALLTTSPLPNDDFFKTLTLAADQFIVARGAQKTVIAGYHWFSDWGRDTMIALPGLTLTTGRADIARSILLEFARHVDRGMLPNRFPDAGEEPEYNTVDATLWYFEAVRALLAHTQDYAFVRENLYEVLTDILAWHLRGTRYQIHVDEDGLLYAGEPGVQLTWMDAKVGDWVVTPRIGKPVEIQALWYNALCVMEDLARKFNDFAAAERYGTLAERARRSFNELFWNEAADCLYDVVNGEQRDGSLRPNQIIAVSLPHSMLDEERARRVVAAVQRELHTPYGLRSLSPNDPQYIGRYEGGIVQRDGAYHQGTVWAWLLGPFITAYVKTNGGAAQCRKQVQAWLSGLREHLDETGQIAEIFDGDAPHQPRGCLAQAWSVAALLRAAAESLGLKQTKA